MILKVLDCYTFEGKVEFMTFTGPEEHPVNFTLLVAEDADPDLLEVAARSLAQFLINQHYLGGSDTLESDEY